MSELRDLIEDCEDPAELHRVMHPGSRALSAAEEYALRKLGRGLPRGAAACLVAAFEADRR